MIADTCYSFVNATQSMHVAAVYRYDEKQRSMVAMKETTGTSAAPNAADGARAIGWVYNILYDTFGSNLSLQV